MKYFRYAFLSTTTLLIAAVGIAGTLFGPAIQDQLHKDYIRSQGREVVKILGFKGGGATGFITTAGSGRIVVMTNAHVCQLAVNNQLLVDYKGDRYVVPVIKSYQNNDLCALVAPSEAKPLKVATSARNGQIVYVLGHPLLEPISNTTGELSGNVSVEILVAINPEPGQCDGETYRREDSGLIEKIFGINEFCVRNLIAKASTTSILPGNSGSPVLDNYGNVVAVAFASSGAGVRSYFVPLEDLQAFLAEL